MKILFSVYPLGRGGTRDQDRGTIPPPPKAKTGVPPYPGQDRGTLSPLPRTGPGRFCDADGMPLAFTQDDKDFVTDFNVLKNCLQRTVK